MKLYISFNITDLQRALDIAEQVNSSCDAFEIGPVLLTNYGIQAISEFRKKFPQKTLIADTNIAEFEKEITELAIESGCDWVTVLAGTGTNSIHNTCLSAHKKGKKVMIDLIDTTTSGQIAIDAKSFGADALIAHTMDNSVYMLLDHWDMIKGNTTLPIFISSHVNRENIAELIKLDPEGIVIGSSIVKSESPATEAAYFYHIIKKHK